MLFATQTGVTTKYQAVKRIQSREERRIALSYL